ncbi:MAG: choice-of-anchor D domain-containing protein [Sulfuricurvum sp.]
MKRIVDTLVLTLLVLLTFSFTAHADGTIDLSAKPTDFGNVVVNSSTSLSYTIQNTNKDTTLSINSITITGADASSFRVTGFTPVVNLTKKPTFGSPKTTSFNILFEPTTLGEKTARVTINHSDGSNNPTTFTIKGNSVCATNSTPAGKFTSTTDEDSDPKSGNLSKGSELYYTYGIPADGKIIFDKNGANTDITYTYGLNSCASAEAPDGGELLVHTGDVVHLKLRNSTTATRNTSRNYNYTLTFIPAHLLVPNITLSGNSRPIDNGTTITSPLNLTDFEMVLNGTQATREYTITNIGKAPLNIASITLDGNDSFSIAGATPASIPADGSASFSVEFKPTAKGTQETKITISSDAPADPAYTFVLRGDGVDEMPLAYGEYDICYTKPTSSGGLLCMGIIDIGGCRLTTEFKNTSGSTLQDVTIVKAYQGVDLSFMSGIGIDGVSKTPNKDSDQAEITNSLNDLTKLNGIIDFNIFNKGVTYRVGNFTTSGSSSAHSVYTQTFMGFSFKNTQYYAVYNKGGVEYNTKVSLCAEPVNFGERGFELRTKHNIKGDIKVIGNTVLCQKNSSDQCIDHTGTSSNADINLQYVNTDNFQTGTFKNSSRAKLEIDPKAHIVWAGLYTQGYLKGQTKTGDVTKHFDGSGSIDENIYITVGDRTYTSRPAITDAVANSSKGYTYDTFAPLNQIVGKKGSEVNGWVSTANVKAYTGTDKSNETGGSGLGNFGAWTLVVVYEYDDETTRDNENIKSKNITVFDGYRKVADETGKKEVNIGVEGFITPLKGDVTSQLSIFAGEGDKNIPGDKLALRAGTSGGFTYINNTNAFNSSITNDVQRQPSFSNNQGIDIQNHQVGDNGVGIIGNDIKSATIKLESTQDTYFPSMVAFTTELYEPDVCYKEDVFFNDLPIDDDNPVSKGDTVEFRVAITNLDFEAAQGVFIEREFAENSELEYIPNSLKMGEGIDGSGEYKTLDPRTDATGDDTAQFQVNTAKFYVGSGATPIEGGKVDFNADSSGGTLVPKYDYSFAYKAKIKKEESFKSTYKVSYRNEKLGLSFNGESIRQCYDFDNTYDVSVASGGFNVVHHDINNAGKSFEADDDTSASDPNNALFTQVVGKSFIADLINFDNTNKNPQTPTKDTKITLSLVKVDGNLNPVESYKFKYGGSEMTSVTLTLPAGGSPILTFEIIPIEVAKDVRFMMQDENGETLFSRDNFSIRPASYTIDPKDALIGGQPVPFELVAVPMEGDDIGIYNGKVSKQNTLYKLIVPDANCSLPSDEGELNIFDQLQNQISSFTFEENKKEVFFKYPNVGKVEITITDNTWTQKDQSKDDCLVDEHTNTEDASGRVGCNISATDTFVFIPKNLDLGVALANSGNGFTYIADDANQSASINVRYTALLGDDTPATNYTKDCFAKNLATNITFDQDINALGHGPAKDRITYYGDGNTSTQDGNTSNGSANFTSSEQSFSSGVADITYKFNFARDATIPDNPFAISSNMFNINTVDDDAVNGSADLNATGSSDATFLYGRAHAAKHYFVGDSGSANIYFEAYCYDATCAKSLLPNGNDSKRTSDVRWYINEAHQAGDGAVQSLIPLSTMPTASTPSSPSNGKSNSTITYDGSKSYPYTGELELNADAHLVDDNSKSFQAEFSKDGAWAGRGDSNSTTQTIGTQRDDDNRTLKSNRVLW